MKRVGVRSLILIAFLGLSLSSCTRCSQEAPPKAAAPRPAAAPTPAPAVIRFEEAALFDFDKADLKQEGKEQLNAYREKAQADLSSAEKVRIVGYTDNTGTAEYNSKLSQQRSEAVRDYLVGIGADPKKMEAIGAAGADPIANNGTKEGRAKNRRVEIEVFGLAK